MSPDEFDQWLAAPRLARRPLVMGILNLTPDSFSDGGEFVHIEAAVRHAREMIAHGADLIDIGGESTRPGSSPVTADVQIARVLPVVTEIVKQDLPVTLSIDTTQSVVAEAAIDRGVHVINDISAGRDDRKMFFVASLTCAPIILMHMQGTPATMQRAPRYQDVVQEVKCFLADRAMAAAEVGIAQKQILLDPGIGFGKTVAHNLQLLRGLPQLVEMEWPVVVGSSRKGFIGKITGETPASHRPFGTAATVAWAVAQGAGIVRVHDVEPMSQVVRMIRAIQAADVTG